MSIPSIIRSSRATCRVIGALAAILLLPAYVRAQLPDTEIKDLRTGRKATFSSAIAKDRFTIVSVWATSCAPCKREIKNIIAKLPAWQKEAPVDLVAVSIDETKSEGLARTYALSQGWDFPSYIDVTASLKRSLNFQFCPYTVVIGKKGEIIYSHMGYEEGGENELFEKVKAQQ